MLNCIDGEIFAIRQEALENLCELQAAGVVPRQREVEPSPGAIAVLPLFGFLSHRASFLQMIFGGTSLQNFKAGFRHAVADPGVDSILIEIDSPGGSVQQLEETGDEIFAARKSGKKIVGHVNGMMASGAFWIGSQVHELWSSPSSETGSVGVFATHFDVSQALEKKGVKVSYITSAGSPYKNELQPEQPLKDSARAYLQKRVDDHFETFVAHLARGRGMNSYTVKKDFGEGRMLSAKDALRVGAIDRIGTIDEAIASLMPRRSRAEDPGKPSAHRAGKLFRQDDDSDVYGF